MAEPGTPKPQRRESVARQRQVAFEVDIPKLLATGAVAAVGAIIGAVLTFLAQMSEIDRKYANLNASLEDTHLAQMAEIQRKYDNLDAEMQVKYEAANREVDIKMIEIGLAILSGEKGDAEELKSDPGYTIPRTFAIKALSKASGIALSEDDVKAWAKAGATTLGWADIASRLTGPWTVESPRVIEPERITFAVKDPTGRISEYQITMDPVVDCGISRLALHDKMRQVLPLFGPTTVWWKSSVATEAMKKWNAITGCKVALPPEFTIP